MRTPKIVLVLPFAAVFACGSSSSSSPPAGPAGASAAQGGASSSSAGGPSSNGGAPSSNAGAPASGAGASSGPAGAAGAPTSACDAFGHYPAATNTFTLPVPSNGHLEHDDIQKDFPMVDWTTLDRLYVPAGIYKSLDLGNLPTRDASRPLVITNQGGQVQVGPNDPGGNFIWSMSGGSNWILTGRYDEDSKTGDQAFVGHRCGDYADARGHYGFFSDDEYATGQYLHMGVAVTNATDFEIEFVEVERSGFAGIRLLNSRAAGDAAMPMANVKVHDTYVHDTDGEGYYFGWTGDPPSNLFPGLQIYNNRVLRTGNEALQIQDLGDGTEVHHNFFGFASLHWRDNGLGMYQDNATQELVRSGTISIHDNVIAGGGSNLINFFCSQEPGDADVHVTFKDNYFADTLSLTGYLNGKSAATSSFTFQGNAFTGLAFGYDKLDPTAMDPGILFGKNDPMKGAVLFDGNTWDAADKKLTYAIQVNGTEDVMTGTNNTVGTVPRFAFVQSDDYDADPKRHLETWAPVATLSPNSPAITYQPGDVVSYKGDLYKCTTASTNETPADHPASWSKLATPVDDVRAAAGSTYVGKGVY